NRLLPEDLVDRDEWQKNVFWLTWLASGIHAFWRTREVLLAEAAPAWREQTLVVAVLAFAAPVLNWVTTGDHLLATLKAEYWPVAGIDLFLLTTGVIASLIAIRLRRPALVHTRLATN
ncbi:MAG TPA: hypothetical protein VIV63_08880, partial [Steroidobacteraceae bacterium]